MYVLARRSGICTGEMTYCFSIGQSAGQKGPPQGRSRTGRKDSEFRTDTGDQVIASERWYVRTGVATGQGTIFEVSWCNGDG